MFFHRFRSYFVLYAKEETQQKGEQTNVELQTTEETGWQRVRVLWHRIYAGDAEYNDAATIRSSFFWGALTGMVYGGMFASKEDISSFIRKHNEYTFTGKFEARRRLVDYIVLQALRLGFKMSWRFSLFSGCTTFLFVTAITYRNDLYISDFVASGAIVGGLWKVKMGLKGMISGASIAGTFALICGSLCKLGLLCTNTTIPEVRAKMNNDYAFYLQREKALANKKFVEEYDKESFKHLLEHQQRLEKVKENILWSEGFFEEEK